MKLSKAFSLLTDLRLAIQAAFIPCLLALWSHPLLLLSPVAVSRLFMAHVWLAFGDDVDNGGNIVKQGLIPENARGVVLDLGAGHGHTAHYLNRPKITKYIALEPNTLMHPHIQKTAAEAGFHQSDDTLQILSCGAEDISLILSALGGPHSVDTITCILTLCSVPQPEKTLHTLLDNVLKSGGQFLYYEHVRSPRKDVVWWQNFWTPLWKMVFDGCSLNRPSDALIKNMDVWSEGTSWGKPDEDEENIFFHQVGRYLKG